MKKCTGCKEIKNIKMFSKDKNKKDGTAIYCKECTMNFRHSKEGLTSMIYGDQCSSAKHRGYNSPTYSSKELREWLFSQKKFHLIYDNWKRLDFQKDYRPSVDRKDDYISYTISNIQLMTWKQNREKGNLDRKEGRNNKSNKSVLQFTKDGNFVKEYYSAKEASRQTEIMPQTITHCCNKDKHRKTAGGYVWEWKVRSQT